MPKATPAVAAEANDVETVAVEWRDLKFEVPIAKDDWPLEVTMALEDGRWTQALRGLVPAEQFRAFAATKPKTREAGELLGVIVDALGFKDAGE